MFTCCAVTPLHYYTFIFTSVREYSESLKNRTTILFFREIFLIVYHKIVHVFFPRSPFDKRKESIAWYSRSGDWNDNRKLYFRLLRLIMKKKKEQSYGKFQFLFYYFKFWSEFVRFVWTHTDFTFAPISTIVVYFRRYQIVSVFWYFIEVDFFFLFSQKRIKKKRRKT